MEGQAQEFAGLLVSGWGVLYSVSLGWSFYNLLDQWPRILRFGSIWNKGLLRFRPGEHFSRMVICWFLTLLLVAISLGGLVRGAFRFGDSAWGVSEWWFAAIFALIGLTVFIIPLFINRAVWGLALICFPTQFVDHVEQPENRVYWQGRFTVETARKLYTRPQYAGSRVCIESVLIVLVLSWAVSGAYPKSLYFSNDVYWIIAPLFGLLVAFFGHFAWPQHVSVDEKNLPATLGGKLDKRHFHDNQGDTWIGYVADFQACLSQLPGADQLRARRLVFCRRDLKEVFETDPPPKSLSDLSDSDLRELLEVARQPFKR